MTGAEFIAQTLLTGSLFGSEVGDGIDGLADAVPFPYADDVTGRRGSRVLRRDYGLFEVTCESSPDGVIQALSLEVHRLLHRPDLRDEVHRRLGIRFEPYTNAADVQRAYERIPGPGPLDVLVETPGYRVLRNRSVGVAVQVVDDPGATREGFPGHGDVWKLDIYAPRFMR